MEENIFWIGISISMLLVVAGNYAVLYFSKWAAGRELLLYGLWVNLAWIGSNFLIFLFAYAMDARIVGWKRMIFVSSTHLLIPIFAVAGAILLLNRVGKTRDDRPKRIFLVSIFVSILSLAIFLGGTALTLAIADRLFPPTV